MNRLVYLDTETLGLTPGVHDIWEVAWAVDGEPEIHSAFLAHSYYPHQDIAMEIGHYKERFNSVLVNPHDERDLYDTLEGATIVGANPAFDAAMLSARWGGATPWKYRLVDIESYALALFGWDRPKGLSYIVQALNDRGWHLPDPDHTAAGDVEALRRAYRVLRDEYAPQIVKTP